MHFTCAARTDVGIVRSGNEDNYLMLADHGIFIVADGMGGHAAGEVASEMAVRITSQAIGSVRGLTDEEASERVRTAIRAANDAIFERTLSEQDKRGMGTTATVLVLLPQRYLIGQVGDSRAYLFRNGQFQQLTKDHSYVQEQVDAGLLTPDQARVHPYSNVITDASEPGSTWCLTSTSVRWIRGTYSCWHRTGSLECWRTSSCCRSCGLKVVLRCGWIRWWPRRIAGEVWTTSPPS
ncbi:MAG: PP2C family protein-serine/threonine phosphatase [Gemmatimonadales bacterium]